MLWGRVRVGGLATSRAGMRCMTRLLPFQSNPGQKTLVTKHTPQFPAHLHIVAPVAPASFGSPPSARRLHGLEGLTSHQFAVKSCGKHQEDIGRQIGEILISGCVLAPAPGN